MLTLRALGAVTPLTTVTVTTQISGLLMSVGFKERQVVHKGDFLAQMDPRPYEVAPADGRVGLRQVDPGNHIQAGSSTGLGCVAALATRLLTPNYLIHFTLRRPRCLSAARYPRPDGV